MLSPHHYHPSQCSRSWHKASREHRSPPPSPASWWRDRPQLTQTHVDTHLRETGQSETVHIQGYCCIRRLFLNSLWTHVRVPTSLVQYKVFIDGKGALYWTVLVYFLFNFVLIWRDTVWGFTCKNIRMIIAFLLQGFVLVYFYIYIFFNLFIVFFTIMLILFVARGVSSFTREDTLRCVSTFSAAGRSAAIHMVLTGGNGVRTAT